MKIGIKNKKLNNNSNNLYDFMQASPIKDIDFNIKRNVSKETRKAAL
ncbi:MAG: hypothetical protein LBV16_04815 [Elusimicrobiota bacterium]|jgi:hypothetical protein|nr:hypothetical protein [Elusimicrobiota bacterium]